MSGQRESDVVLRELLAAATPGPRGYLSSTGEVECVYVDPEFTSTLTVETTDGASAGTDAALIAAAVNALPALLDEIEALTAQRDRAERRHERLESAVEALADEWAADYPGPDAACNRTPDEWATELRALLADRSTR